MKIFMSILFVLATLISSGQQLLVAWYFPDNSADTVADAGWEANLNRAVFTMGGTSAIDFKNGFENKAAQVTSWDNGNGLKCWAISFTTINAGDIKISSRLSSGGNNPGPKDWKIEYRIGVDGSWEDVPNSEFIIANDWTTGYVNQLPLPEQCNNKELVYLRWIMKSNNNTAGGTVDPSGICKIDNIEVHAYSFAGMDEPGLEQTVTIGPNPATDFIRISNSSEEITVKLYDLQGKLLQSSGLGTTHQLSVKGLEQGIYTILISDKSDNLYKKVLVR